jgi:hypothetical protein
MLEPVVFSTEIDVVNASFKCPVADGVACP